MKCPICGTNVQTGAEKCPTCGKVLQVSDSDQVYTGKKKSKTVAAILMLFGIGDLYLLTFGRFFGKMALMFFTLGFGTAIWGIIDMVNILRGKINCDARGVPLV